jgi:hypothetical protein
VEKWKNIKKHKNIKKKQIYGFQILAWTSFDKILLLCFLYVYEFQF